MGLFSVLQNSSRHLLTSSAGVHVHSNNVSNAHTVGYARQELEVQARGSIRSHGGLLLGQGVDAGQVGSAYDRFAQRGVFLRTAADGRAQVRAYQMRAIEGEVVPAGAAGLQSAINRFFESFSALESEPDSLAARAQVLARAGQMAQQFQLSSAAITRRQGDLDTQIQLTVDRVNELTTEVAALDRNIVELENIGAGAHDLRARRTAALEELAAYGPVQVDEDLNGRITVLFGSHTVVENGESVALQTQVNAVTGFLDVAIQQGAGLLDITGQINQGHIAGLVETRDVTLQALLNDLDQLAFDLGTNVNAVHAAGFDLAGVTGVNFFTIAGPAGAAAGIDLDPAVDGNPAAIAGATNAALLPGDNTNVQALHTLGSQLLAGGGTRTFAGQISDVLAQLGQDAQIAYIDERGEAARLEAAKNLRDERSGVNLEEEALDLVKWRDSYQAASRVISTTNELLDTLFQLV